MENKLLKSSQELVDYVHSNMGESCLCMFCGHHHIHTDETNMKERYERKVCPFVEFERVVIEATQQGGQSDECTVCNSTVGLQSFVLCERHAQQI